MNTADTSAPMVSVVIPVYNKAETIGPMLEAVYNSAYPNFEVVVVNDCSTDNCMEVLKGFTGTYPHRLVALKENMGVSVARNIGAQKAAGEIILFIDADCIIMPDTMARCVERLGAGGDCVGGAYTKDAWDKDFFSNFQSLYIHYVETKNEHPDYIATHCMAIRRDLFREFGGFVENSFIGHQASVEDVEFSHRLTRAGRRLLRPADILVRHMFGFSLARSIRNAVKKSKYWTMYSLKRRDVMKDSGAASHELKVNVTTQVLNLVLVVLALATRVWWLLLPVPLLYGVNVGASFRLFQLMRRERGWWFLLRALGYYQFVYPVAVAYGSFIGTLKYLWEVKILRRYA